MQKSRVVAVVIGGIVVAIAIIVIFASQPTEIVNPITLSTDKDSYESGNPAIITVTVHISPKVFKGENVELQIVDGNRTSYLSKTVQYIYPGSNITYSLDLGGEEAKAGQYWVLAKYGAYEAQSSFQYEGFKPTNEVKCKQLSLCTFRLHKDNVSYEIPFRFNGTIENMTANGITQTLTITLKPAEESGSLQIAIPRQVVDARAGQDGRSGADEDFVVFADETPSDDVSEFSTKEGTWAENLGISGNLEGYRILVIPIEQGTETIEIVATFPI